MYNNNDWTHANKLWATEFLTFAHDFVGKCDSKTLTVKDVQIANRYIEIFERKDVINLKDNNKYAIFYDFCQKVNC